eukprot:m.155402 g.155402  ORF g.155402 m.155402 type:complete len:50 (-) comp52909_c0_seq1:132-281(-)
MFLVPFLFLLFLGPQSVHFCENGMNFLRQLLLRAFSLSSPLTAELRASY